MRYNFKLDEQLQMTEFCCEDCLIEDIIEAFLQSRKYETIEVYAKADLIEELIGMLHGLVIDDNEFKFGMIDFDGKSLDYDDIYCLSISDDYTLWVEPAYRLNEETNRYKLFNSEAILAYVYQEDCKQDLFDKLEENEVPTLLFGLYE